MERIQLPRAAHGFDVSERLEQPVADSLGRVVEVQVDLAIAQQGSCFS